MRTAPGASRALQRTHIAVVVHREFATGGDPSVSTTVACNPLQLSHGACVSIITDLGDPDVLQAGLLKWGNQGGLGHTFEGLVHPELVELRLSNLVTRLMRIDAYETRPEECWLQIVLADLSMILVLEELGLAKTVERNPDICE